MSEKVNKYWILSCDSSRYDIHTLFKESGCCLWNQRRNYEVGDIIYIYETKPVSKIVYKAIVEEINIRRDKPENEDNFYTRDFNREYAFKMKCIAVNNSNRLQFNELAQKFGISGMTLVRIPEVTEKDVIEFFEDVFAGKVENLPAPPTLEELYQPLEQGTINEHIKHKMDFCQIRDSHLAKQVGISSSSIGRVRKGGTIKSELALVILKALGFAFINCSESDVIIETDEIAEVVISRINASGIRPTDLAKHCNASISVISHLKNNKVLPKLEVFEKILAYYDFKVVLKRDHEK